MTAALNRLGMRAEDTTASRRRRRSCKIGTMTLEQAIEALRERADEMVQITQRWVEVNSFTENVDGVNRVADLIADEFASLGMTLDRRPSGRFGDHLIWRTEAAAAGRAILLIGHHDTV